jgi:pyrimidine-nucleoside phosphorylase
MEMDAVSLIDLKRNHTRPHTRAELEWLISQHATGGIPDYQMSAWLMAVCWRGLDKEETAILTSCMVQSGKTLSWPLLSLPFTSPRPLYLVDKHSTGGVGDKISLVLAPLVASLGVNVPMMAGRGLGHTGGTIDKLESIPGYQTALDIFQFQDICQTIGCSIVAASLDLCPADRKLYALRDVTATVSCIPLQTASIMCKKIAEKPQSLVLDVKYGTASFQPTTQDAQALAESMIRTGESNGLAPTVAFLTRHDSYIGYAVGNWVEVVECLQMMKTGQGAADFKTLVVVQAAQMLLQSGKYDHTNGDNDYTPDTEMTWNDMVELVLKQLESGLAYSFFRNMVQAHGGNVDVCDHPATSLARPKQAQFVQSIAATQQGFVFMWNGRTIGTLCIQLGAGRQVADQAVDPSAGIVFAVKVGDFVQVGDVLATVQTNRSQRVLDQVCAKLQACLEYSPTTTHTTAHLTCVISHKVTSKGGVEPFVLPTCLLHLANK